MELQYIACFFSLELTEFDFLESTLKKYDIGTYCIAHEAEPKSHFHLLFEGTPSVYTNFSKVIIEKYKLRRKGRGGVIKYGKVKNIRNLERMLTYTLKDGNFRSNMDKNQLNEYFTKSFKKVLKNELIDNIVEHIDNYILSDVDSDGSPRCIHFASESTCWIANISDFSDNTLLPQLLDYLVENDIKHTYSQLENFKYQYIIRNTFFDKEQKKEMIRAYIAHRSNYKNI